MLIIWIIFISFVNCFNDDIMVQQVYNNLKTSFGNTKKKKKKKKHHHKKKHHKKKKKHTSYSTTTNLHSITTRTTLIQTIPSTTSILPINSTPPITLTPTTDPTPILDPFQYTHQSHTSDHRLALGLGLGFGCLSIFILFYLIFYSYRKRKAMYCHTIQSDNGNFFATPKPILDTVPAIHTKWRPNSFLNAVHLVVSKLPKSRSSGTVSDFTSKESL